MPRAPNEKAQIFFRLDLEWTPGLELVIRRAVLALASLGGLLAAISGLS